MLYFFFFKQKTAYELRISDWSSDVCSSDLRPPRRRDGADREDGPCLGRDRAARVCRADRGRRRAARRHAARADERGDRGEARVRSEEHTSELQSLMRISYAVFCLKKTKKQQTGKTENKRHTAQKDHNDQRN